MKTLILKVTIACLLLVILFDKGSAQVIQSLNVLPANPTTTDTLYLYANIDFPSGGCSDKAQNIFVSSPYIFGAALHCLGVATFICNETDTFQLAPLAAGTYTFIFTVEAGMGPSPCTPGIVPGPVDSITIVVTNATGIGEVKTKNQIFNLTQGSYPGKVLVQLTPEIKLAGSVQIVVYNLSGQLVHQENIVSHLQEMSMENFNQGLYLFQLRTDNGMVQTQKYSLQQK